MPLYERHANINRILNHPEKNPRQIDFRMQAKKVKGGKKKGKKRKTFAG